MESDLIATHFSQSHPLLRRMLDSVDILLFFNLESIVAGIFFTGHAILSRNGGEKIREAYKLLLGGDLSRSSKLNQRRIICQSHCEIGNRER